MASTSLANAATLIPVPPVPGSTATAVLGINDSNTISGSYRTADGNNHGFFGTLDGNYTTFDIDPAYTAAYAINNAGYVVGGTNKDGEQVAFERYPDGSVHFLTIDGRTMSAATAYAINRKGLFVGTGYDGNVRHPFIAKNAEFQSDVVVPGAGGVEPRGINDSGDISGHYGRHGFLLKDGVVTLIDYPDPEAHYNFVRDVNDKDVVVGYWLERGFRHGHPFIFDARNATYTPINVPHSKYGGADSINSAGLVTVSTDVGSFIYCPYPKKSSKCPAGGAEIADAEPIRALPRAHH